MLQCAPAGYVEGEFQTRELSGYPYRITRRFLELNFTAPCDPDAPASSPTPPPFLPDAPVASAASEDDKFKEKFRTHRVAADTVDHYEALGLAHLRWSATPSQIRTAFRKMSLQYHPDKLSQAAEGGAVTDDSVFKRIAKAYEVLSDTQKRKEYDSTDSFDDKVPTERDVEASCETVEGFLEVFGPVFDRNSRWSVLTQQGRGNEVPRLGGEDASREEVERFYEFWYDFKSWREFKLEEEYDPAEAESRDERRWIARQNEKQRMKKRKEEHARVMGLVDLAHRKDPRVQRFRDEENRLRMAKKQAKRDQARMREESHRAEAEEVAKAEKDAEVAKEKERVDRVRALDRAKNRVMRALSSNRALCDTILSYLFGNDAKIIELSSRFPDDVMKSPDKCEEIARAEFAAIKQQREQHHAAAAAVPSPATSAPAPTAVVWTDRDIELLNKAAKKYPTGVHDRWNKIADMMGGGHTVEDIVAKSQELKNRDLHGVVHDNPYSRLKEKTSHRDIDSPLDVAWDRLNTAGVSAVVAPPVVAPPPAKKPAEKPWSAEEQKLLEEGLKKFKGQADRWERISQTIAGRTKEDCQARFNHVRQMLLEKKQQQQAQTK